MTEAWGRGGTGTGDGTVAGPVTDADVGPEGRCSGWSRTIAIAIADVGGVVSGRAIGGAADDGGFGCGGRGACGGRRVVLSMEDQPPVRNAGAG